MIKALIAACLVGAALSFPNDANTIPNGNNVLGGALAVAHPGGNTKALTSFARDYQAAGHAWTVALCQKDSNKDGITNGQHLGDPNCGWKVGQVPFSTVNITAP
jgi:hypothetical protein